MRETQKRMNREGRRERKKKGERKKMEKTDLEFIKTGRFRCQSDGEKNKELIVQSKERKKKEIGYKNDTRLREKG